MVILFSHICNAIICFLRNLKILIFCLIITIPHKVIIILRVQVIEKFVFVQVHMTCVSNSGSDISCKFLLFM